MQDHPDNKSDEISIVVLSDTVAQVDTVMVESQRTSSTAEAMMAGVRD